jgi:hypothetical protein
MDRTALPAVKTLAVVFPLSSQRTCAKRAVSEFHQQQGVSVARGGKRSRAFIRFRFLSVPIAEWGKCQAPVRTAGFDNPLGRINLNLN